MEQYKKDFIDFLVKTKSLKFGEFTLKSGRAAPYFFNVGGIDDGEQVEQLGYFYACKIKEELGEDFDVLFGPAYKGIPLVLATAIALKQKFGINKPFSYNRKEAKNYAEKGIILGRQLEDGDKLVMLDDVMTTGGTKVDTINMINEVAKVGWKMIIIGLDREEVNDEGKNAVSDFPKEFGIPVKAIVTVHDVIDHLSGTPDLSDDMKQKILDYLEKYGEK